MRNSSSSERLWQIVSVLAVVTLVVNSGALIRREVRTRAGSTVVPTMSSATASAGRGSIVPVKLSQSDWARVKSGGHQIGSATEQPALVVFSDFECPFCARFANEVIPELEKKFPGRLSIVFRHWPLENHRWAYPAARAAECATQHGKFREFHDVLFRKQKEIGTKSFTEFAQEVNIGNLDEFERCASVRDRVVTIDSDIAEARAIHGRGTPTLRLTAVKSAPKPTLASKVSS